MASYTLKNITHSSVTFAVNNIEYKTVENEDGSIDTYDYVNVRFFVRLTADENDETIDEKVTLYGETSIEKTFDTLKPLTEYTVNVQIYTDHPNDGAWVGAKEISTTERATTAAGTIAEIPVLDADYPLFSWSDWPISQAALYEGGLTADFEKECWNAIIGHLSDALTKAGYAWKDLYTTAEEAKITEEYGDLYANAFNSVRHNIDRLAPLGWRWADTPSFHGYIGREDFLGVDAAGENGADDVYHTYFIELVRKLNVLIQIMRADSDVVLFLTAQKQITSDYRSGATHGIAAAINFNNESLKSIYWNGARKGFAAVISSPPESIKSLLKADARQGRGAVLSREELAASRSKATTKRGSGAAIHSVSEPIQSLYGAAARAGVSQRIYHEEQLSSVSELNILTGIPRFTSYKNGLLESVSKVAAKNGISVYVAGTGEAYSANSTNARDGTAAYIGSSEKTYSTSKAEPRKSIAIHMSLEAKAKSVSKIAVLEPVVVQIVTKVHLASTTNADVRLVEGTSVTAMPVTDSDSSIEFEWAWEPPVWIAPGELHVIQAWDESSLTDGILKVI